MEVYLLSKHMGDGVLIRGNSTCKNGRLGNKGKYNYEGP